MKFAQLFILVLAFFIIRPAKAGLLIEPVLGYNIGKVDVSNPSFSKENYTGPSYGGRLGYQNLGFQLGLDYLKSSLNVNDNNFKKDLNVDEWAGFVGFEFPVLLRVYAGYIFSAEADSTVGTNKLTMTGGTGTKFGLGFTGLPFVDINFEYRKGTFDEFKLGATKFADETTYESFMIGISLPFVL